MDITDLWPSFAKECRHSITRFSNINNDGSPRSPFQPSAYARTPADGGATYTYEEKRAVLKVLREAHRPLVMFQLAEMSNIKQEKMEKILPILVREGYVKCIETREATRYCLPDTTL
ncbi:MAG: hypothetical protein NTW96_19490 [Planctomycetia bacterium]|nr:hypothetical protein [Planctomycetia bacterium]